MKLPIKKMDLKKISSKFGYRIHPIYKDKRLHNGIDYPAKKGEKVYSVLDGKVIVSKFGNGVGEYITILHTDNTYSMYAHLSVRAVSSGTFVKEGQYIGQVGSTGDSTGPHLHFGMCKKYNAASINASEWFDPLPKLEEASVEIKETKISYNGKIIKTKGILLEGTNYIAIRPYEEGKGNKVGWDSKNKMVIVEGEN